MPCGFPASQQHIKTSVMPSALVSGILQLFCLFYICSLVGMAAVLVVFLFWCWGLNQVLMNAGHVACSRARTLSSHLHVPSSSGSPSGPHSRSPSELSPSHLLLSEVVLSPPSENTVGRLPWQPLLAEEELSVFDSAVDSMSCISSCWGLWVSSEW